MTHLQRGDTDVLIRSAPPTGPDIVTLPLFAEPLLLAVPVDDPLAEADPDNVALTAGTGELSDGLACAC